MGISSLGDGSSREVRNAATTAVRSAGRSWTTRLWGHLSFLATLISSLFGRRISPAPTSPLTEGRVTSGSGTETAAKADACRERVLSGSLASTERSDSLLSLGSSKEELSERSVSALSLGSSPEDARPVSPIWSGSISTAESGLQRLRQLESAKDYKTILVEYAQISNLPDIQETWKKAYNALLWQVNPYHSWEGNKTAELLVTFAPQYYGQKDPRLLSRVSAFLRIAALTIRNTKALSEAQNATLTALVKAIDGGASVETIATLCEKAYKSVGADKCASVALCYKALTGKVLK